MLRAIEMVTRRRTDRIALQLAGRWVRAEISSPIVVADINADGLFLSEEAEPTTRNEMPLGQLQRVEVDLPMATVNLLVVPRYTVRSEWSRGRGLEIFAATPLDRNLWLSCFRAASAAATPPAPLTATPPQMSRPAKARRLPGRAVWSARFGRRS